MNKSLKYAGQPEYVESDDDTPWIINNHYICISVSQNVFYIFENGILFYFIYFYSHKFIFTHQLFFYFFALLIIYQSTYSF